jgi:hypothetical protein
VKSEQWPPHWSAFTPLVQSIPAVWQLLLWQSAQKLLLHDWCSEQSLSCAQLTQPSSI